MHRLSPAALVVLMALAAALPAVAGSADTTAHGPKRVLIFNSRGPHFEPFSTVVSTFRTELARNSPDPAEFHEISLESARFAGNEIEQPLADYVRVFSADRPFDLVVPIGAGALDFCARYRDRFGPDVPFLVAGIERRRLSGFELDDRTTGVAFTLDLEGLVEDVLRVLPATTAITVAIGSSALEQYWADQMRQEWARFEDRIEFTWLNDLTLAQMQARVSTLPADAAVIFTIVDVDAAGVPYEQNVALDSLCSAASVPVFGMFEPGMGRGLTGGRLVDVRAVGVESARLAVRILGGESPAAIPTVEVPPPPPTFDWRELRRWGIQEALLPAGSEVRFRQPTFWQVYRWRIIVVGALCVVETILIALWLSNRLRLRSARAAGRQATIEVQELRRELNHTDRVSLLGQVTTSLAHELGQPLGAILRNADAAELYMKSTPPDLEEVRAILADVRRDGERASAVIERLRALLRRRGIEMQPLGWNELVDEVMSIVRGDAHVRNITLEIDTPPDLPPVRGDRIHLQQVLLNLVANAMDAIDGVHGGERRISVRTRSIDGGGIECEVSDTGVGITPDRLGGIFDPFVTTKTSGMGMGLPISRTIVEAHGGQLWAAENAGHGATFRFTIPAAPPREYHV
jgi:signal transduction histidine kinase